MSNRFNDSRYPKGGETNRGAVQAPYRIRREGRASFALCIHIAGRCEYTIHSWAGLGLTMSDE